LDRWNVDGGLFGGWDLPQPLSLSEVPQAIFLKMVGAQSLRSEVSSL
jgi:hypothetical protein